MIKPVSEMLDPAELAAWFDTCPVAMLVLDQAGTIGYANQQAGSMLGMPSVSLSGRPLREFLHHLPDPLPGEGGVTAMLPIPSGIPRPVRLRLRPTSFQGGPASMLVLEEDLDPGSTQDLESYRALFASGSDALILGETDTGRILDVNPAAIAMYGYDRPTMLGMRDCEVSAEPDRTRKVTLAGSTKIPLGWHRKRDGTVFPVEIHTGHFLLHGRRRYIAAIRDLTNQLAAEEQFLRNQARLQSLLAVLQREAGSIQEWLDHALDEAISLTSSTIGYIYFYDEDRREFTLNTWSKGVMDVCHIANPGSIYHLDRTGIWGEAVRQRKPIVLNDFAAPHPLKKGYPAGHAPLHRFLTVPVFAGERIVAVVGVANKTTAYDETDAQQLALLMNSVWKEVEHKRVQLALYEEKQYFQHLFDHMTNGVAVYEAVDDGADFVFVDLNPAGQRLSQLSKAEVLGRRLTSVFPGAAILGLLEALRRAWRTGEPQSVPLTLYQDERLSQWVENRVFKLPSGRVVAHYEDRTEQRNLEDQLSHARRLDAIGQLAGGVAHDFNNQLQSMLGYSELLLTRLSDQCCQQYVERIRSAAQRSADLTRKLLAFSRKGQFRSAAVEVHALIRETAEMLRHTIDPRISIELDLAADRATVIGDASQIQSALLNLAVNARDAMRQGGTLRFTTRQVQVAADFEPGVQPGEHLLLEVIDTGCGMSPQIQAHLFEPFFTTKGVGQGTGMGLASVYGTVKMQHGSIRVTSAPGCGTTFHISLPLAPLTSRPAAEVTSATRPATRGRILLIEDEPLVRDLMVELLRAADLEVVTAIDSPTGVEMYREQSNRFDLIILDMLMPKMGGTEVFKALRTINPQVRVLLSSGYSLDHEAQTLLDAGARGFVQKPCTHEALLQAIDQAMTG